MKCLTTVFVTEVRLEAGFSTRDILQAMLAHTSVTAVQFTVQGAEVIPGENHKCDFLPHKVQQVKGEQGQEHSLEGIRNTTHLVLTFTGSRTTTGSDRRSSGAFWAGENLGVGWRTVGNRLKLYSC